MSGSDVGTGGGAGEVVRQGHLKKLKTMKKKYFVLRAENAEHSARLEYYESEKKFRAGATPRRVLSLKSCYNIIRRLDLKQRHVIALFTREEQFCIVADNEQELHAWLAAILKHHRSDETSGQLHHPIQHVWQVNVQKKGLGAVKNIHGLYNLCLTDKTLTLVKIKSQNNVISELGIPERVEYSLKNIRRCGDSECFFYMEVGRQTTTGAGELWMLSEDSNIAQSMHSTIYHAMRNCARETENERDHIVLPKGEGLPARRQTYSDGRGRAGLTGEKGLCVGACIRQCVCSATYSIEDSAALAPELANDAGTLRNRCDSMPSRACSSFEIERPPPRHNDLEGLEASRDEPDAVAEWYRTPRIPEEPDVCDVSKDLMNLSVVSGSSIQHSRTSSLGVEDAEGEREGYLRMRAEDLEPGRVSSSASVCSGTPSTDPRFSEYNLEPATSHITGEWRPPRAYSVGSRPTPRAGGEGRHRAYSVGARGRPAPRADDLMLLDFSSDARAAALAHHALHYKTSQPSPVPRTPPRPRTDEYVDMSPRGAQGVQGAGYVLMTPGEMKAPAPAPATPEGYVEMSFGRAPTRPIAIAAARAPPPATASPDDRLNSVRASHGSQIFEFSNSLESPQSPQSPAAPAPDLHDDDTTAHTTPTETEDEPVQEVTTEPLGIITLDKGAAEVSCSPQYVTLKALASEELPANPTANKLVARQDSNECNAETNAAVVVAGGSNAARFSVCSSGTFSCSPLHYAALDLEPRRAPAAPAPRAYTQIDFVRSEKLHAYDAT